MALDTVSTSNEEADLRLKWSGRFSLKQRILALNLLTVLLVALSTIYLLEAARTERATFKVMRAVSDALGVAPESITEFRRSMDV